MNIICGLSLVIYDIFNFNELLAFLNNNILHTHKSLKNKNIVKNQRETTENILIFKFDYR